MEDLTKKMNTFFGESNLIMVSCYEQEEKKLGVTEKELKQYLGILNQTEGGVDLINKKACILYHLCKIDEDYIGEFKNEIITTVRKSDNIDEENNMIRIFNITHFFKDFGTKILDNFTWFKNYLVKYGDVGKNFDYYILYDLSISIYEILGKSYNQAFTQLQKILNTLCDKQEKFKTYPFLFTLRKVATEELIEAYSHLSDAEKQKMNHYAIKEFSYKGYSCLPILEEMIKDIENRFDSDSNENIEATLVIATRIGYIGFLLNESDVIKKAFEEMSKALKFTQKWVETINDNANKKKVEEENKFSEEDQHKLAINLAYNFVLTIINNGSKDSQIDKMAKDFRENFFPYLDNIESNNIVSKENQYDFILDISNVLTDDKDCRLFIKKISSEEIIQEFKKQKISNDKILTYIFTIHSEINKLSEEYFLQQNPNTKGEIEKSIINYGETILDYISRQSKDQPVINKPIVLSAIIEIYSSLIHICLRKNDKASVAKYMSLFKKIKDTFFINEKAPRAPAYGLLSKIDGDFEYFKNDYENAEKKYEEAIALDYSNPMIYFNLAFMNYLTHKHKEALENLKKCKKMLEEIDITKYPNNSSGRKKMLETNYTMVKRLVSVLENN